MKLEFNKMFEPTPYREVAAEAIREYMQEREYSADAKIRGRAHFEGYLTPYNFNKAISYAIDEADVSAMKEMGYRLLEFGRFRWEKVVSAFEIYRQHYGDLNIPLEFVIDESVISSGIGYDLSFEDMQLGEFAESIRTGDVDGLEDPERRRVLDGLGFQWGNVEAYQRYRFLPMLIGLRLFKHLNGFASPQSDFVVPDEPQWPFWMAGMPLGEWAAVAKIQQAMVEEYYPERRELLNVLGFIWWVPPGKMAKNYYTPLTMV